ncbi:MAG TPA: oligosaccharide flippase family protein [Anaerolineae bacterium]|nr:oligosaccharide flippase family protein [Anaerolineae bacterium]
MKGTWLKQAGRSLVFDPTTRGWLQLLAGIAGRVGLSFLTGILVVRALGPADFGVYSLLMAVMGLAGVIFDFGLTEAAVKAIAARWSENPAAARWQAQNFFWLRLSLAAIGLALGLALAQPISTYLLNLPGQSLLFGLALLGAGATVLSGSMNALLQATNHFGRLSAVLMGSSAVGLGLAGLLFLASRLNLLTALIGLGAGTALVGFAIGWWLLPQALSADASSPLGWPGGQTLLTESPALLRFGRWLWLANIFKVLIAYLDMFLLNLWLAPAAVGFYALALGLAGRVEMVNHSLYTVLISTASALKSRSDLERYLRQGWIRSGVISLMLLLLLPLATWFIPFFYGATFTGAVGLFQLLLGVVIFDIITLPVLLLIYTFDRPDLAAWAEGVRVVTLLLLGLWLIPILGPVGAVVAKLGAKVVGVGLTVGLLLKHYGQISHD